MRVHAFHHLYQYRLDNSTKPFNARGCKVQRCQYCQVSSKYCICEHQPSIESDVAVMLIVSENEVFKPSNTGRLILDTIKEGYAYQWNRTEPDKSMLALLEDSQYQPILVFPDEYIDDKSRLVHGDAREFCGGKKPLLIFLDGSWREARRMFRKSPYLDSLPVLSISPSTLSRYMMRRSDNEQHLATAEVASLVLDEVKEHSAAQTLHYWFETFKESYMLSKSRGKVDEQRIAMKGFIALSQNESPL